VARALARLGFIARRVGDIQQAVAFCDEGLRLSRQLGDSETTAHVLICYGQVVRGLGEYERANTYWEEARLLARVAGETILESQALFLRANVAMLHGDLERSEMLIRDALNLIHERGDRWSRIPTLETLARVAQQRSDIEQVVVLAQDIASSYREVGNRAGLATAASVLAWAARVREDDPRAARLLGASDAVMAASGRLRTLEDQSAHDSDVALVRAALGEDAFTAAWAEGRAMTFEQAVQYILQRDGPDASAEPDAPPTAGDPNASPASPTREVPALTRREAEVARLLARGFSNRQIAEALVISERTADSHVYRLLGKLGVSSRAQAAVWAVRHGFGDPSD